MILHSYERPMDTKVAVRAELIEEDSLKASNEPLEHGFRTQARALGASILARVLPATLRRG